MSDAAVATSVAPGFSVGGVGAKLRRFAPVGSRSTALLLGTTLTALAWANSPWSDAYFDLWTTHASIAIGDYELGMDLRHWVNDGLMVLFFFAIGLEVRHELSVGELKNRSRLTVPFLGAVGGLVIPAAIYLLVLGGGEGAKGWGVVIGTDTAFLLAGLAIVGPRLATQLRVFLLTMTIADDLLAVSVIALVYSDAINPAAFALAALALLGIGVLGRMGEWRTALYLLALALLWVATFESGVHPSFAGMAAGLLVPSFLPRRGEVEAATRHFRAFRQSPTPDVGHSARLSIQRAISANERMQMFLLPWTGYVIVPVFALANAGVDLRGGVLEDALASRLTWAVVGGLVFGKLLGVGLGSLGAVGLRLGSLPQGVGPGQVLGGAALSGMGFTVSLLVASLAFDDPALKNEATVGILLAAALSLLSGWVMFRLAAVLRGEVTATLPLFLDRPVDPERDHIRGRVDAPVTLVEYADFECPFCGAVTTIIADLCKQFGDDLRYVFRHLPLVDIHPHAQLAAEASEAAGAQGRFWEMHDLLFLHQGELELEDLLGYAGDLDLDVEQFARDLAEGVATERVQADVASAEASGARRTPTFFIGDRRHIGRWDTETLAAALRGALADSVPGAEVEK